MQGTDSEGAAKSGDGCCGSGFGSAAKSGFGGDVEVHLLFW